MSKFSSLRDLQSKRDAHDSSEPEAIGPEATEPTIGRKRAPGKRSRADYRQVTAYIRNETHHQVKLALLAKGGDQDFSDLVEQLLSEWLTQTKDSRN